MKRSVLAAGVVLAGLAAAPAFAQSATVNDHTVPLGVAVRRSTAKVWEPASDAVKV